MKSNVDNLSEFSSILILSSKVRFDILMLSESKQAVEINEQKEKYFFVYILHILYLLLMYILFVLISSRFFMFLGCVWERDGFWTLSLKHSHVSMTLR